MNARRVPAKLAESLLSGVNALSDQTPVCLPSIPTPVATTTPTPTPEPAPVAPPAHHEKPPHHEKHPHGDGKHEDKDH